MGRMVCFIKKIKKKLSTLELGPDYKRKRFQCFKYIPEMNENVV